MSKADIILLLILAVGLVVFFLSPKALLITTGRYGQGKEEDNKVVNSIFGEEYAKERFELYFQWYNVVHEIGHGIIFSNGNYRPKIVDEEQLVNDFAIAFWEYYGEEDKFSELEDTVKYALENIRRPVDKDISHMDYARENWGKKEFFTFNNYGWFQFSCVENSLSKKRTLEEVLDEMGVRNIKVQPQKILVYQTIDENTTTKIIADVVTILHEWNVEFPNIYHKFSDDPNVNMIQQKRNILRVLDLFYKKINVEKNL